MATESIACQYISSTTGAHKRSWCVPAVVLTVVGPIRTLINIYKACTYVMCCLNNTVCACTCTSPVISIQPVPSVALASVGAGSIDTALLAPVGGTASTFIDV